jgi:hypothetical protein
MRFAAAVALTLLAATARADGPDRPTSGNAPRSTTVAYALAIVGTLAPLYAGNELQRDRHAEAAAMAAGLCWGPSLGFGYGGAWKTALLSGALKSALLGAAAYADHRSLPAIAIRGTRT